MADFTVYLNGKWIAHDEMTISADDRGFVRGDAVFDTERTFNGRPFRLKEHIGRLDRSLRFVRIDPGLSPEEMLEITEEAVLRNRQHLAEVGDFSITQFVTRGFGRWAHRAHAPTVGVKVGPVDFTRFARFYDGGVHGVIARTRAYPVESLDPKVKHHSRMNFALAELEVGDVDPDAWPIVLDTSGNLAEGTGHNVFLVTGGVLRTPGRRSTLMGVSRGVVMELARQLGLPVAEEELQPYDLYTADEAFFASTFPCILPINMVDRRPLGLEAPGPVTRQLLAAWSELVGVDIVGQARKFARA